MNVAFLGTGLMGGPMAARLADAGISLTVYNRTASKAEPLRAKGARVASTPREAIEFAECVVLMVADGPAVREILLPTDSPPILEGRTILQMSTIAPSESIEIARKVAAKGAHYLECPVLGSTPQAAGGKLILMAGGDATLFEQWKDFLKHFGPNPIRIGQVGKASALKLVLNQMIACLNAVYGLSYGFVERNGIDPAVFLGILRQSPLFAPTFEQKTQRMKDRDFENPHFPVRHMLKDVRLFLKAAGEFPLDTSALRGVESIFARALDAGLGDLDYSAQYQVINPPKKSGA